MVDIPIGLASVLCTGLLAGGTAATVAIIKFVPSRSGNRNGKLCKRHLPMAERITRVEAESGHTAEAVKELTGEVRSGFRRLHERFDELTKEK